MAGAQHGLIRRSDLAGQGVTGREIDWRILGGRVDVPHPGVYYLNSTPATWKTAVLAAVMAAGPDALASHRCAAVVWGFDAVYGRTIEVTVPYVESPEPAGVIVHRRDGPTLLRWWTRSDHDTRAHTLRHRTDTAGPHPGKSG